MSKLEHDGTSNLALGYILTEHTRDVRQCEEPGCREAGDVQCVLSDEMGRDISQYYCPHHAGENGFCSCCGTFIDGISTAFDTLCDNCRDEIDDYYDDEVDDDFYYPDDGPPY